MPSKDRLLRIIALQSILIVSLSVTVWRVIDFTDEWLNAGFQMSMLQFRLTGDAALITQIIIIAVFGACACWAARRLFTRQ
jgi:hypothetical protein